MTTSRSRVLPLRQLPALLLLLLLLVAAAGAAATATADATSVEASKSAAAAEESISAPPAGVLDDYAVLRFLTQPETHFDDDAAVIDRIVERISAVPSGKLHRRPKLSSTRLLAEHSRQPDYVSLLEEGGHAVATERVRGSKTGSYLFRSVIQNVERMVALVSALVVGIADHAYVGMQAGFSLLGLGGGVALTLSVELSVLETLARILFNFSTLYFEMDEARGSLLRTLRGFKRRISDAFGERCATDMAATFESSAIGIEVGIDLNVVRGVISAGLALVAPTLGVSLSIPLGNAVLNALGCISTGMSNLLYGIGDHHPRYANYLYKAGSIFQKSASALHGVSEGLADMLTSDNFKYKLGYGMDLGKGMFGVGLGLKFVCQRKPGSDESKSCTDDLRTLMGKITDKVTKLMKRRGSGGRRRLLGRSARAVDSLRARFHRALRATVQARTNEEFIELSREHTELARQLYHELTAHVHRSRAVAALRGPAMATAMTTPATSTTALLEVSVNELAQLKFIVCTTLLIVGITSAVIGGKTALEMASHDDPDSFVGEEDLEENIGNIAAAGFKEGVSARPTDPGHSGHSECLDGVVIGYDFVAKAFGFGAFAGPLSNCFASLCRKMLRFIRMGTEEEIAAKCSIDPNGRIKQLLAEPPEEAESVNPEDMAVYRWRDGNNKKENEELAPLGRWSSELKLKWGRKTSEFNIHDKTNFNSRIFYLEVQFRIPRDHNVEITMHTTNSDKLGDFQGAFVDCINGPPYMGRKQHNGHKTPFVNLDRAVQGEWEGDRKLLVGPTGMLPYDCGGVHAYPRDRVTNFYLRMYNHNGWTVSRLKLSFRKIQLRAHKLSSLHMGELVTGTGSSGKKYYGQVIRRPKAGEVPETECCSGFCDGITCAERPACACPGGTWPDCASCPHPVDSASNAPDDGETETTETDDSSSLCASIGEASSGSCKETQEDARTRWQCLKGELELLAGQICEQHPTAEGCNGEQQEGAKGKKSSDKPSAEQTLQRNRLSKAVDAAQDALEQTSLRQCESKSSEASDDYLVMLVDPKDPEKILVNAETEGRVLKAARREQLTRVYKDDGERVEWVHSLDTVDFTGLLHGGRRCWAACGEKAGSCKFCGTGKCCNNGQTGNDCLCVPNS